jgi:hypothetical protein
VILATAYSYNTFVERSFLTHGHAKGKIEKIETKTRAESLAQLFAVHQIEIFVSYQIATANRMEEKRNESSGTTGASEISDAIRIGYGWPTFDCWEVAGWANDGDLVENQGRTGNAQSCVSVRDF